MLIKDLVKSPQERALENLIWDRLSSFWTQVYDQSDKDAINAMYDAFLKTLDAEYVRLFQIDDNKSLYTAPVYTQRRWARLDLNKYDTLKKWFRFLTGGDPAITIGTSGVGGGGSGGGGTGTTTDPVIPDNTGIPGGSSASSCGTAETNHTKHWHINFPWQMANDRSRSVTERQTIELSLPIFQALTAVWKMSAAGVGTRLAPGLDYVIGANGKSIRIIRAAVGTHYEIATAFDLSNAVFDGLSPSMVAPLGFELPGTLLLPPGFGNGLPIHALVVRNPPASSVSPFDGTISSSASNTPLFTTERFFIPSAYGTDDGIAYKSKDRATLPVGFSLNANDIVLLFGLAQSPGVPTHSHVHTTRVIRSPNGITDVELYEYEAGQPAFGMLDLFANEFRISVNGSLCSPADYQFDSLTGRLTFKAVQLADQDGNVRIDLEYTNETVGATDSLDLSGHLHYTCVVTIAEVPEVYDTFDDGGIYDDDLDPIGKFDSKTALNVVTFDVNADLTTLNVYLDGVLQNLTSDYTAAIIGSGNSLQLRIFFVNQIKGKTVSVTYRAPALFVQIGGADLSRSSGAAAAGTDTRSMSNQYGITQNVLNSLAANFIQVTHAFKTAYGVSDADMQRLIEAAYIASVGGNPVMTLFFDEFPEYADMPIDAQGLILSAANSRAIECAGTDFVDIPYLQDSVLNPSIRLFAGTDYIVKRGELAGSASLFRKRGPDDATPGQWWVPLLVLDEQFLSKNFGTLVGDLRISSESYRDALAANLMLRYQGATRGNVHRAVCSYLGSSAFQSDAKVVGYVKQITGYTVTVRGSSGNAQDTFDMRNDDRLPTVGDAVYPGQSMRGSTVYDMKVLGLIGHTNSSIFITDDVHLLLPGDTVRMQMTDPVYGMITWMRLIVDRVEVVTDAPTQYSIVHFTRVTSYLPFSGMMFRASRDNGAPYASIEGFVTSVDPSEKKYLQLSTGVRIEVPLGAPEVFTSGEQVYRGDPLDPSLALVYDDISRPDWYKYTVADFQEALKGRVEFDDGRIGSGYITVAPSTQSISLAFYPVPPSLAIGQLVTLRFNATVTTVCKIVSSSTTAGSFYAEFNTGSHLPILSSGVTTTALCDLGAVTYTVEVGNVGELPGTDYALVTISPIPDSLVRGTKLVMVSDRDGTTSTLEVSGPGAGPGEYYAKTPKTGTTVSTGTVDIQRAVSTTSQFLEVSPAVGGVAPTVLVTSKIRIGATTCSVSDTTDFPTSGRCRLTLHDGPGDTAGTTVEVSYTGKGKYELRNLQWGSRGMIDSEIYGAHSSDVVIGCVFTLIGRYADTLINPAFASLVKKRTKLPGSTASVVVTADNAKVLYDLLKSTSTIIETSVMSHPVPMLAVLADSTPVGSTTLIYSKQIFSDSLDINPSDSASPAMFYTPTVSISAADPTTVPVTPGNIPVIWLTSGMMSIGLGSTLDLGASTGPFLPGQLESPFEYRWTVTNESNVRTPFKTTSLTGPTLGIDIGDVQSILYVKLKVTHPATKAFCTSVVRVRRFNEPHISVVVTSPTTGTPLIGGAWNVPTPNPVISLLAVLDPVAPPVGLGPYTYSWAVVNEAAPFVAPTITGGTTAAPTLSGVAANAVLKVTLTVTASGINAGLNRTYQKISTIRLV